MTSQPVIVIHGGSCWASYKEYLGELKNSDFDVDFSPQPEWHKKLQKNLGAGFKVLLPAMPNWQNAKYVEWKIWFEKAVAVSGRTPIVVGHSLGAIFLTKYFAETTRPLKLKGLFLVSTPYATLTENRDFGDFALKRPPRRLHRTVKTIYFYQSKDDPIVGAENLSRYREFVPRATVRLFKNRGHFIQGRFPELIEDVKSVQ
jgi:predicted alpha/beta hydrolase family esterase